MARIRTIKPEFFRHEDLFELEKETNLPLRVAFAGLFTVADREGRFKWKPRRLKLDVLPWDDIPFEKVLDALNSGGFIIKYTINNESYAYIPNWHEHQKIRNDEMKSNIPEPKRGESTRTHTDSSESTRVRNESTTTRHCVDENSHRGKERKGKEYGREGNRETVPGPQQHKQKFAINNHLQKIQDETIKFLLGNISTSAQKTWVEKYKDPILIEHHLRNAVDHYTSTEGLSAYEVSDWGKKLVGWMRRQQNFNSSKKPKDRFQELSEQNEIDALFEKEGA